MDVFTFWAFLQTWMVCPFFCTLRTPFPPMGSPSSHVQPARSTCTGPRHCWEEELSIGTSFRYAQTCCISGMSTRRYALHTGFGSVDCCRIYQSSDPRAVPLPRRAYFFSSRAVSKLRSAGAVLRASCFELRASYFVFSFYFRGSNAGVCKDLSSVLISVSREHFECLTELICVFSLKHPCAKKR